MDIFALLKQPWAWYVAGPLIGLTVPLLLLIGNKSFGISANLRHLCALVPNKLEFLNYDWRKEGAWNLSFALGIMLGALLASTGLSNPQPLEVAASTQQDLSHLGIQVDGALLPQQLFSLAALKKWQVWLFLYVGGLCIGFGTRYAGGCTSGHAIAGLANWQLPSLVAVIAFFIGGLIMSHLLLPYLLAFIGP